MRQVRSLTPVETIPKTEWDVDGCRHQKIPVPVDSVRVMRRLSDVIIMGDLLASSLVMS